MLPILLALLAAAEPLPASEVPPERKLIVGGVPSPIAERPFLVSLWTPDRYLCGHGCKIPAKHDCGGALVHEQWVLTAAHCWRLVYGDTPGAAYFGLVNQSAPTDAVRLPIGAFIPHPGYARGSDTPTHDIALVRLARPVRGFAPIRLDSPNSDLQRSGTRLTAAGWGNTAGFGSPTKYSDTPQEVEVPVMPCGFDHVICAGTKTQGASFGDSGGPLWGKIDGSPVLVGAVEGGLDIASQRGQFARVSYYRDWIAAVMHSPLTPGSRVALKGGRSRRWCTSEPQAGRVACDRDSAGPGETFEVVDAGGGKIALQGGRVGHRQYCADYGRGMACNSSKLGDRERFEVQVLSREGQRTVVALRGGQDHLLCVGESDAVRCNSDRAAEWGAFEVELAPEGCRGAGADCAGRKLLAVDDSVEMAGAAQTEPARGRRALALLALLSLPLAAVARRRLPGGCSAAAGDSLGALAAPASP